MQCDKTLEFDLFLIYFFILFYFILRAIIAVTLYILKGLSLTVSMQDRPFLWATTRLLALLFLSPRGEELW